MRYYKYKYYKAIKSSIRKQRNFIERGYWKVYKWFLSSLMKVCLPLMKNVFTSIDENLSVVLVLTVAVSATDATTQNKILELEMTTLIISNKEL